jgi:hypothetical protein
MFWQDSVRVWPGATTALLSTHYVSSMWYVTQTQRQADSQTDTQTDRHTQTAREAMLKSIADRAAQMLKYAAWMYKQASPLCPAAAPADLPSIWSKAGVRGGDLCGPLFFPITLQDALYAIRSWHDECMQDIAYLDDVFLQGPAASVSRAYGDLQGLAGNLGLQLQAAKCTVFSRNSDNAHSIGSRLGFAVNTEGIVAAGRPVGKPSFVEEEAGKSATRAAALVKQLTSLNLPVQYQLLPLRKSLQLKLSHLMRCSEFEHMMSALLKVKQAIMAAILQLIRREEHNVDVEQIRLLLRLRGVGIQCLKEDKGLVCRAGFNAAAALTQQALATPP